MPPRSVCLNVFTTSLGEGNAAVNNDGNAMMGAVGNMERRDSAQSDIVRRSSAGSIASQPTPTSTSPLPTINRADLFHSLRPMASTESLNYALTSKRKFSFSFTMWRAAGTRLHSLRCISVHVDSTFPTP
ncbi:hypothetical protein BDW02DRAFT_574929 [Decorospora gaudefroyi]|uniref:Uncharacterized protein n=1 Tax=Decorospora gaudefroyi TaxID=184978 RepID=A0A6A5K4L4_9PLEO|nr:hypothetical protein BDW02DRAFT_574929 [Decorospora gaudefroyi]